MRRGFLQGVFGDERARSPMQWSSAPRAGFTAAATPWCPIHPHFIDVNVEVRAQWRVFVSTGVCDRWIFDLRFAIDGCMIYVKLKTKYARDYPPSACDLETENFNYCVE